MQFNVFKMIYPVQYLSNNLPHSTQCKDLLDFKNELKIDIE